MTLTLLSQEVGDGSWREKRVMKWWLRAAELDCFASLYRITSKLFFEYGEAICVKTAVYSLFFASKVPFFCQGQGFHLQYEYVAKQ